jgi:hypothetical protein
MGEVPGFCGARAPESVLYCPVLGCRANVLLLLAALGCSASPTPPPAEPVPVPVTGLHLVVWADPDCLTRYDVTMDTVLLRLKEARVEILSRQGTRIAVRGDEAELLLNLVLQQRNGVPIKLRDVARVEARR